MPLQPGFRLGPYEILAPLGAGGMGEVYRARDTKLNRDVALKVLLEAFLKDAERVARFTREAQVLASLNHPHIGHIHGLEDAGEMTALVLEFIDGPTLADRIARGPLPVDEALTLARQIADALDAAHARGVIHRDLKPANIKIAADGRAKVLDFGLAKLSGPVEAGQDQLSQSPTLSLAGTFAGMILGTAAYMSPEQARGRPVDKRADIWAFGVVLFEMVTGRQPFTGGDLSEILASVIKEQPLYDDVPPRLRRLIQKCLEKEAAKRLRDIGDVWELLDVAPTVASGAPAPTKSRGPLVAWTLAGVMTVATASMAWLALHRSAEAIPQATTADLDLPVNGSLMVLSPDGRMLSFGSNIGGTPAGKNSIWIRVLDTGDVRMLPGTEGYSYNFTWSADSRYLAFIQDGRLRKVAVSGGPPSTIAENVRTAGRGGAWNRDGVILLGSGTGIMRVSSQGELVPLTTLDPSGKDYDHISPAFLPDGKHFLYVRTAFDRRNAAIFAGSIDNSPNQQPTTPVIAATQFGTSDAHVYFVSTDDREPEHGYVIFKRDNTVLAQSFDAGKLTVTGEPIPLSGADVRFFTVARAVLAYNTGATASSQLTWFDRAGKILGRVGDPMAQAEINLSPDATRVATAASRTSRVVLALDTVQNTTTRITTDPMAASTPVWSPDGRQIAVAVRREGRLDLFRVSAIGAGQPQLLFKTIAFPQSWRGNTLLFAPAPGQGVSDLWTLALDKEDVKPVPYLASPASERQGQFSPDGKWVAYTSDESGTFEVYVSSYPDPTKSKTTISSGGGNMPRWSRDGKELLYFAPDDALTAVPVTTGDQFKAGTRSPLFKAAVVRSIPWGAGWDVAPDGRFLINLNLDQAKALPATLVLNWQSRLSIGEPH